MKAYSFPLTMIAFAFSISIRAEAQTIQRQRIEAGAAAQHCLSFAAHKVRSGGDNHLASRLEQTQERAMSKTLSLTGLTRKEFEHFMEESEMSGMTQRVINESGGCECIIITMISGNASLKDKYCLN